MSPAAGPAGDASKAAVASEQAGHADDLRLAWLHLRLGQLTLARAELEDLAARDGLGPDGLAPLAEVRWRTGAAEPAAAAARAHLAAGGTDEVAICIAAEAAAAAGDLDEAHALMDRLGSPDPTLLDILFGGMPRRATWPAASGDAPADRAGGRRSVEPASPVPGPRNVLEAMGMAPGHAPDGGSPDSAALTAARPELERRAIVAWDPVAQLRRAREELASRPERAFVRLALVLRLDPTLAPAVLDAVALRREPAAVLVRGDAQRLLGRHLEAEAAFDAAAESLEAT